jgi:hypothetical protein
MAHGGRGEQVRVAAALGLGVALSRLEASDAGAGLLSEKLFSQMVEVSSGTS